ncbi:hypothetical protein [Chryseobacterium jejuense]|uniref:Uncharacterized protein n=1 Tax=Chryseobacterium jejuense TaxID=445960 RepID=A0A2X2Z8P2_CHRJE|nr:hypothetical protein [Chryseobacterium jejuense]SDJ59883.1 hypothetical protein SAMN05421542_3944 [Chryseobacterium jejuense]SQB46069.1 Uncharacterised protein [Chryseobacterium jejuense]
MKTKILLLLFILFSMKLFSQFSFSNLNRGISLQENEKRHWFPARFNNSKSVEAKDFFEGKDSTRLFQNSNVVYNTHLKNFSLNSEVVNDYFRAIRVGIGFQLNSTVSDTNGTTTDQMKKDQLISSLQNGGGNLFINAKYPILAIGRETDSFGLKAYIYHNTGIELTSINTPDNDFILTHNTGIVLGGFGMGIKNNIAIFFQAKGALLYGNSKYNRVLSSDTNFKHILPMVNINVGINFLNMYTVKVDFYPVGQYFKDNFPATISFVITPKKENKNGK